MMSRNVSGSTALGSALGTMLLAFAATAQAQTPAPSAPAGATQVPPAVYVVSGWRVECASPGGALACQVLDQVTSRANNTVIASVSVTLGSDGKTPYAIVQTPLGVAVDSPVRMATPNGAKQTLTFLTCTGAGCFARAPLSDAMLAAMHSANQTLTVTYDALNGISAKQSVTTTLALDGFTAAYGKLH